MGSGSGSSTTTVKRLPDYCEIYVTQFLIRSSALSTEAYVPYWDTLGADPTIAPQPANETAAIALLATRGRNGNATISKGITFIQDVLDGDYLLGLDAIFQASLDLVHNNLVTQFTNEVLPLLGASPLVMGDLSAENLASSLAAGRGAVWSARIQAKLYAENYRSGRLMQDRVRAHGLAYASAAYKDGETLRLAGLYQREYNQASAEDSYKHWIDVEISRVKRLEILGNAIRAMVGTQYTKTTPLFKPSPVTGFVGGAVAGAQIGAMSGNPYGVAIGAVVGGIVGAVGSQA
jgi:hypothetical protein